MFPTFSASSFEAYLETHASIEGHWFAVEVVRNVCLAESSALGRALSKASYSKSVLREPISLEPNQYPPFSVEWSTLPEAVGVDQMIA
jgi:hypothetical protein